MEKPYSGFKPKKSNYGCCPAVLLDEKVMAGNSPPCILRRLPVPTRIDQPGHPECELPCTELHRLMIPHGFPTPFAGC